MTQTLIVNNGELEFTNFNAAIRELEEEYGYEGWLWEMVKDSGDLEVLGSFLRIVKGFNCSILKY